jgi:DNA-binding MarR family transcriptional regulator
MSDLTETISCLSDHIEKMFEETLNMFDFEDLTQHQLYYLKIIVKMKNPTQTELARELGLTKPTVTVLVDRLTEKGYIKRVNSDEDRRVMHLHIDTKGEKINTLRKVAHKKITGKIKAGLTDAEIEILTGLIRKILNHT